jgi:hypothetical protein
LSALFLSPLPIQRAADRAADSVTRTNSNAMLRSGGMGIDSPLKVGRLEG